jgi:hypothetical protein
MWIQAEVGIVAIFAIEKKQCNKQQDSREKPKYISSYLKHNWGSVKECRSIFLSQNWILFMIDTL